MNTGKHTRLERLADIPVSAWTGYVWLSNEDQPAILQEQEYDLTSHETPRGPTNPFIVEANLHCESTSISIRHVDGSYLINKVDWDAEGDGPTRNKTVLGHAVFGGRKLVFREAWIPEENPACEKMNTLVPAWVGFVGFEKGGTENA